MTKAPKHAAAGATPRARAENSLAAAAGVVDDVQDLLRCLQEAALEGGPPVSHYATLAEVVSQRTERIRTFLDQVENELTGAGL